MDELAEVGDVAAEGVGDQVVLARQGGDLPGLVEVDQRRGHRGDASRVHLQQQRRYRESGCGKTVLFRALLGLLPDTARVEGSLRFGREPMDMDGSLPRQ